MKKPKVDWIEVQFGLVHDCIRACIYADHIANAKPKEAAWLSIVDMCYSDAIISWNAIFGNNSQETHWEKLLEVLPPPLNSALKPFSKAIIFHGYILYTGWQLSSAVISIG